eukprot:2484863-Amphidinium_carterae.1
MARGVEPLPKRPKGEDVEPPALDLTQDEDEIPDRQPATSKPHPDDEGRPQDRPLWPARGEPSREVPIPPGLRCVLQRGRSAWSLAMPART